MYPMRPRPGVRVGSGPAAPRGCGMDGNDLLAGSLVVFADFELGAAISPRE
jgi:hypothetical protein